MAVPWSPGPDGQGDALCHCRGTKCLLLPKRKGQSGWRRAWKSCGNITGFVGQTQTSAVIDGEICTQSRRGFAHHEPPRWSPALVWDAGDVQRGLRGGEDPAGPCSPSPPLAPLRGTPETPSTLCPHWRSSPYVYPKATAPTLCIPQGVSPAAAGRSLMFLKEKK